MSTSLPRRIGRFVAPMVAGNVLQLVCGTASTAMLGRLAGAHALACAGVLFPITMLCYSFASGLTSGATILIARDEGAQNARAVKNVIAQGLALALAAGAVFAFVGMIFGAPILHALRTPPTIFAPALAYLRISMISMIAVVPYMMYDALLEGLGDSQTPFVMLAAATLLTLVLMPALIVGIAVFPKLGVLGAPAGSFVSLALVTLVTALAAPRLHEPFRIPATQLPSLLREVRVAWDILRLGTPVAMQYIAVSASQLVVLSMIAAAGALAVAAYAAVNQIIDYVTTPISMLAIAASAFAAKSFGARQGQEIASILRASLVMMLLLTCAFTLLAYVFIRPLLALFLADQAAAELARRAAAAVLWSLPVLGIGAIASAIVRSEQHPVGPMIANAIGVWLVLLPCARVLAAHHGIIGVWQAYPIAYVAIAAMEVAYFAVTWRRLQGELQPRAL